MRISVVATGIDAAEVTSRRPVIQLVTENERATTSRADHDDEPVRAPPAAAIAPSPVQAQAAEPAAARTAAVEREAARRETFVVPPPSEVPGGRPAYVAQPAVAPDPYAAAAMENGGRQPEQRPRATRAPSLFERVKSVGRQRTSTEPELPTWNQQPQAGQQRGAQPRLGSVDQSDRILPQKEEELLDIPAFLRRQAN